MAFTTPPLPQWARDVLVLSLGVKLLLVPAYHSTDFEVHRHWLALTSSLPLSQWYFDATSIWTLDYPPFFGYFSRLLAVPVGLLAPRLTDHAALDYATPRAKLVMRLSVIATELVLAAALVALANSARKTSATMQHQRTGLEVAALASAAILLHPALIIVDHMHFQYNGFLTGVLFWSIWAAREQRPLLCAFLFSSLLMLKHIYVYLAPAYFVFLLRTYVLPPSPAATAVASPGPASRLFTLSFITLLPPLVAFLPLMLSGLTKAAPQGPFGIVRQIFARLFPFARGITHAYWAANAWALYTFADRVLLKLAPTAAPLASASRGIVGNTEFAVLPTPTAAHCFILTLLPLIAYAVKLWQRPTYTSFVGMLTLSGLTSFLFGYHVHEKAIILPLLPLTLLAPNTYALSRLTLILSVAGITALFPLLYEARETPIKLAYSIAWGVAVFGALHRHTYRPVPTNLGALAHVAEHVYLCGTAVLQVYVSCLHPLLFSGRAAAVVASSLGASADAVSTAAEAMLESASRITAPATTTPLDVAGSVTQAAAQVGAAAVDSLQVVGEAVAAAAQEASAVIAAPGAAASSVVSAAAAAATSATTSAQAQPQLEFLPLMLTSVYCAVGVVWVWLRLSQLYWSGEGEPEEVSKESRGVGI